MNILNRIAGYLILALIPWIVYVALNISVPLRGDDIAFAQTARAIAKTGLPHFSYGEGNWSAYGLWHPPLYVYLIGEAIRTLGQTEAALRSVGILCFLATAILIYRFCQRLFKDQTIAAIGCGLFLINPIMAQYTLILDIDNTILMLLLTLFLYQTVGSWKEMSLRRHIGLSLLFALILWAKLTTPPFLLLALVLFSLSRHSQWKVGVRLTLITGLVGTAIFLLTWTFYCYVSQCPLLYPIEFTFLGKKAKYLHLGARLQSFEMLALVVAFVATLGLLIWIERSIRPPQPMARLLLIFVGLLLFVYTIWMRAGLKYLTVALPPLCVLIAPFVTDRLRAVPKLAILLLATTLYYLFLPDIRINRDGLTFVLHLFPLLVLLCLSIRTNLVHAISGVLVLAIGLQISQGVKQAFGDYPPARSFTQLVNPTAKHGLRETVSYLNNALPKSAVILCDLEVGYYYASGRYHEIHYSYEPFIHRALRIQVTHTSGKYPDYRWPGTATFQRLFPQFNWTYNIGVPRMPIADFIRDRSTLQTLSAVVDSAPQSFLRDAALRRLIETEFPMVREIGDYKVYTRS